MRKAVIEKLKQKIQKGGKRALLPNQKGKKKQKKNLKLKTQKNWLVMRLRDSEVANGLMSHPMKVTQRII